MLLKKTKQIHPHGHCKCSPIFGFDVLFILQLSFYFVFIQDYVALIYIFTCPAFTFSINFNGSLSYGHYWVVVFPICTL